MKGLDDFRTEMVSGEIEIACNSLLYIIEGLDYGYFDDLRIDLIRVRNCLYSAKEWMK